MRPLAFHAEGDLELTSPEGTTPLAFRDDEVRVYLPSLRSGLSLWRTSRGVSPTLRRRGAALLASFATRASIVVRGRCVASAEPVDGERLRARVRPLALLGAALTSRGRRAG